MNLLRRVAAQVAGLPGRLLIRLIRFYQSWISPMIGPRCRFQPTCSTYFIHAVHKYGAVRGTIRGIARICRCHPFHPGGYDPP